MDRDVGSVPGRHFGRFCHQDVSPCCIRSESIETRADVTKKPPSGETVSKACLFVSLEKPTVP